MGSDGHPYGLPAATAPMDVEPSVLLEAEGLVNGDRAKAYGPIREDYARTVALFKALTGVTLTPEQGIKFMVCVKLSRSANAYRRDNYTDACGYLSKLNDLEAGKE